MSYRNCDQNYNGGGRGGRGRDSRDIRNNRGNRDRNNRDRNDRNNYDELTNDDKKKISDNYAFAEILKKYPDMMEIDNFVVSKELEEIINKKIKYFDELNGEDGLKTSLLKGIITYGLDEPSEIQKRTIGHIIKGRDFLINSQSGTGKTATFVISALQMMDEKLNAPQIIILSHTHELAAQTLTVIENLGMYMDVKVSFSVGKVDRKNNVLELNNGKNTCKIIIATPGRLLDLVEENYDMQGKLFENIKLFILDECDELLGSFRDTVRDIFIKLSVNMQICLFSATLNQDIVDLSLGSSERPGILDNPLKILIKKENMTLDGIKQVEIKVHNEDEKFETLLYILSNLNVEQFIIYVNSKELLYRLNNRLLDNEYSSVCFSSDNSKVERNEILKAFKKGEFKCLITTDVLARGIDIPHLYLVINYEMPNRDNIDNYIHRIGRSGRYGRKGLAINLNMTKNDQNVITLIQITFDCRIYPINKDQLSELII
jgi:superfamily II DNA/RNA helicase